MDPAWEEIYKNNDQMCKWPFTDLVSLVSRNRSNIPVNCKVLELGCGAGPNIPFFLDSGFDYHAIEGSQSIVDKIHSSFPSLEEKVKAGNFVTEPFFDNRYDLIVDRAAITHNTDEEIKTIIDKIYSSLNKGGFFIGVDWFSSKHADAGKGVKIGSKTRTNLDHGQFNGVGKVHFFDENELKGLFSKFSIHGLWHKTRECYTNTDRPLVACWDMVVSKK